MNPTVLAVLAPGFEELEAVAPIDILRRGGAEVTVASVTPETCVKGRNGLGLCVETTLEAVSGQDFDALFLPGGPAVNQVLRAEQRLLERVKAQADAGRWVAAICAAPLVLHDAGVLAGRRFNAHPSARVELPAVTEENWVLDGPVLTSPGAGTAIPFGLALLSLLAGPHTAREVATAICWDGDCPSPSAD